MFFIQTPNKYNGTTQEYGIELDLRTNEGELILHHDAFTNGENFRKFLKYYNHTPIKQVIKHLIYFLTGLPFF